MLRGSLVCSLMLFAALFPACQKKVVKDSAPGPGAAQSIPPERAETFAITIASGGGFTGRYTGYSLQSTGTVRHWEKRGAGAESTLWAADVPPGRVLEFRKALEQGGALAVTRRESGNMTTTVKLELPDTLLIWSWPGDGVDETTPEPFRAWYPQVLIFCMSLEDRSHQEPG